MDKIPTDIISLNRFIREERSKNISYLRKNFSLSDFDIDDIYQEASLALYTNIKEERLTKLTGSLATYFLRICINQALTLCTKKKKTVPIINESNISHKGFSDDRLEELFLLSTEDEGEEFRKRSEVVVDQILSSLPETCKNIFTSYYWQCLSTKSIADMFGYANANTVKAQKYKCVEKFKKRFNSLMANAHE